MSSSNIIWSKYVLNVTTSNFNLRNFEKTKVSIQSCMYFIKFEPALTFDGRSISHSHAKNLMIRNGKLFVTSPILNISLRLNETIRITVLDPSLDDDCESHGNIDLSGSKSKLFSHIFYEESYIGSLSSNWGALLKDLRVILMSKNKGTFGITIGFRNGGNEEIEYFPADDLYKDRSLLEKFGKKLMFITLRSRYRLKFEFAGKEFYADNYCQIIRNILYSIYPLISSQFGGEVNAFARRIINVCLNGGIPINFFDKDVIAPLTDFSGEHFESTVLRLSHGISGISNNSIWSEFGVQLEDFRKNIVFKSNEQAYRSLFWDPVITSLFRDESSDPKILLAPGWNSKELFSNIDQRYFDYSVLFKINSMVVPILIVEIGSELFDLRNIHKDATKMMNSMKLTCSQLAMELEKSGKCSSHARVYGLWIGGSRAQMVVAHPVISSLGYCHEIHVNITFHDHWLVDICNAIETEATCTEPCCHSEGGDRRLPLEYIKPSSISIQTQDPLMNISDTVNLDQPSESDAEQESPLMAEITEMLGTGNFDLLALKRLKVFSRIINNRIDFLNSERSNRNPGDWEKVFKDPKTQFIDQARKSSSSRTRTFILRKYSEAEFSICRRLALFPIFFPKLYSSKPCKAGGFKYKFEKMRPLIHPHEDRLNFPVVKNYAEKFMQALTFSIHCIHGLFILHDELKIVHSDISPNNIMFSDLHKVWKLNDFDGSMGIEESKGSLRKSGTKGYISPEAEESGIFTEFSDIYALGVILKELFYFPLLSFLTWEYGDVILADFKLLEISIFEMNSPSPKERPSAKNLLTRLFDILKGFDYNKKDPIFLSSKSIVNSDENIRNTREDRINGN